MPRGILTIEQRQQQVITRLKNENAKLRARIAALEQENTLLKIQMSDVLVRLEELQRKVFGKKHHKPPQSTILQHPPTSKRSPASYRRPTPPQGDITKTEHFSLQNCPACYTTLTHVKVIVRYQEDILPLKAWKQALKAIEEHRITTGYCSQCKVRVSAIPIQKQVSTLGPEVAQLIPYLSIIQRMSFEQVRNFLKDIAGLAVSDGEMSNILEEQSHKLSSRFEQLKSAVSRQPAAHYDETGWKTQQEKLGNYGWVKTGIESQDAIFLLGRSRGKGNAEELHINNQQQIGITDDYGAYRNLFSKHQLCWAHPLRKLRELAESEHLTEQEHTACTTAYESFSKLYQNMRRVLEEPFDIAQRIAIKEKFQRRFDRIATLSSSDPPKLKRIKETLRKNQKS